jgi:prepilin-type N-terminal cleavage/methylation domain-containing protein
MRFHRSAQKGFTLLEIVASVALISLVAVEGMQVFIKITSKTRDDAQRWKAQLAIESVTDVIATFQEPELKAMIARDSSVGGSVTAFTSATDPWIAKFEDARNLRALKVNFKVYAPGASTPLTSLPVGWELEDYDIEIQTALDFRRNENLPLGEELRWSKRIAHL